MPAHLYTPQPVHTPRRKRIMRDRRLIVRPGVPRVKGNWSFSAPKAAVVGPVTLCALPLGARPRRAAGPPRHALRRRGAASAPPRSASRLSKSGDVLPRSYRGLPPAPGHATRIERRPEDAWAVLFNCLLDRPRFALATRTTDLRIPRQFLTSQQLATGVRRSGFPRNETESAGCKYPFFRVNYASPVSVHPSAPHARLL